MNCISRRQFRSTIRASIYLTIDRTFKRVDDPSGM